MHHLTYSPPFFWWKHLSSTLLANFNYTIYYQLQLPYYTLDPPTQLWGYFQIADYPMIWATLRERSPIKPGRFSQSKEEIHKWPGANHIGSMCFFSKIQVRFSLGKRKSIKEQSTIKTCPKESYRMKFNLWQIMLCAIKKNIHPGFLSQDLTSMCFFRRECSIMISCELPDYGFWGLLSFAIKQ